MGLTLSKLLSRFMAKEPVKILMLGLDGAGKTTILYKLRLGEVVNTIPTIGFNVETVEYKTLSMTVWDVGGQHKIRELWRHYYDGTSAVIFVVDSMDQGRLKEAAVELKDLLCVRELSSAVLLVFANKQDLPGAMDKSDLVDRLDLDKLRDRAWFVQSTCAVTGEGLLEGLDWLSRQLAKKSQNT